MVEVNFSTFSIVANKHNRGIEVMALSDRPEIELNELQQAKEGIDTDIRYQRIMSIVEAAEDEFVQSLISRINQNLADRAGS